MRILVTGASGLVGRVLVPMLHCRGHLVLSQSRGGGAEVVVDLTDPLATAHALDAARPDVVVNLAAMTNVDQCEREPQRAFAANATVVRNLARWIAGTAGSCRLVQVSTDQVYDGPGPHGEERVSPSNYYAMSKYTGELEAARTLVTVLRTNLFGRSRTLARASFSDWVVSALRRCERITVFDDVWFSPLSLETLSELLGQVIERPQFGVFNLGARSGMSKAEFAYALADAVGLSTKSVTRAPSTEANLVARRPKDMRLDCSRFESAFGVTLPTLLSEIDMMRGTYAQQP